MGCGLQGSVGEIGGVLGCWVGCWRNGDVSLSMVSENLAWTEDVEIEVWLSHVKENDSLLESEKEEGACWAPGAAEEEDCTVVSAT